LPVETVFEPLQNKVTEQSIACINPSALRGLFAHAGAQHFRAYQIHRGSTTTISQDGTSAFQLNAASEDGWLSTDGWRAGCYLHGLFENEAFRQAILTALVERRAGQPLYVEASRFDRQAEYDKLAEVLRQHLDLPQLKALCNL
jgi:adenosylcobyric acid synthase